MMKFMVDSNIIIEYMKNSPEAVKIINFIKENDHFEYFITIDTLEEILYILLKHFSKNSYWELKNNWKLTKNIYNMIIPLIKPILGSIFKILHSTEKTQEIFFKVCENYGLLPKDALLLAYCIEYEIDNLLTFDSDFKRIKLKEKINIISSINN